MIKLTSKYGVKVGTSDFDSERGISIIPASTINLKTKTYEKYQRKSSRV